MRNLITFEQARELLNYNPDTGAITRKIKKQGKPITHKEGRYLTIHIDNVSYLQHRLAWLLYYGEWPKSHINHINGIKSDNRIKNLEDVSALVNGNSFRALSSKNTSGYKNVHFDVEKQKWNATKTYYGTSYFLGSYETAEEANAAVEEFNRTKTVRRSNIVQEKIEEVTVEIAQKSKTELAEISTKLADAFNPKLKGRNRLAYRYAIRIKLAQILETLVDAAESGKFTESDLDSKLATLVTTHAK